MELNKMVWINTNLIVLNIAVSAITLGLVITKLWYNRIIISLLVLGFASSYIVYWNKKVGPLL